MKAIKKFFKGFLKYFGSFIAVLAIVAGVKVATFFINRPADTQETAPVGEEEETVLSKILNQIMNMKQGQFSLDFEIVTATTPRPIKVQADVMLNLGGENNSNEVESSGNDISVFIEGNVGFNEIEVNFDATYVESMIYLDIDGMQIKMSSSDVAQDLSTIMGLEIFSKLGTDIALPEISLESFDTSMLMSLANSMTEKAIEGGKEITVDLFGYGSALLYTDESYNLKMIKLNELNIDGTKIKATIGADLNAKLPKILPPENAEEINDISDITKVIESVDNLMKKGELSGNINVQTLGINVNVKYFVDFKDTTNVKAYFNTNIASKDLVINYQNNKVFVTYDQFKYFFDMAEFDLDEILEKLSFYASEFGIEIPVANVEGIIGEINIQKLAGMLQYLNVIDFSDNGISIDADEFSFELSMIDKQFTNLSLSCMEDLKVNVTFAEEVEVNEIDENEYVNIFELEKLFSSLYEQITAKKLATEISVAVDGKAYTFELYLDYVSDLKAKVCGEVEGHYIDVVYKDKVIYVTFDDVKLKYAFDDSLDLNGYIEEVKTLIAGFVAGAVVDFDLSMLENIDESVKLEIISLANDKLELNVEETFISINLEELKLSKVSVKKDNFEFAIKVLSNNFEVVEDGRYIQVNGIVEFAPSILKIVEEKTLALSTTLEIEGEQVEALIKVDFREGLKAQVKIEVLGKTILVTLLDNMVYVDVDNLLSVKGSVDELAEMLAGAMSSMSEVEIGFDFLLDLISTDTTLDFLFQEGIRVGLVREKDSLTNIIIDYSGLNVDFEVVDFEKIEYAADKDYTEISELLSVYESIEALKEKGKISGKIKVEALESTLNVEYVVDFKDATNVKAFFKTNIASKDLMINYQNGNVFITYDEIKCFVDIKEFNLDAIVEEVKAIANKFGFELPEINIELPTIDATTVVGLISLIDEFDISSNGIVLNAEGLSLILNIVDKQFTNLTASYKEDVKVNVTFAEEVEVNEIDEHEYVNIFELEKLFSSLYEQITAKKLATEISVAVDGKAYTFELYLDYISDLKAKVCGEIEDHYIDVVYKDKVIYVTFDDVKLKYAFDDSLDLNAYIEEVKTLIAGFVAGAVVDFDLSMLENIDESVNLEIISLANDKLELNVEETFVSINLEDLKLSKVSVKKDNFEFAIKVLSNNFEVVEDGRYIQVNGIVEFTPSILKIVEEKTLALSTTLEIEGEQVEALIKVDFREGLKAQVKIEALGKTILVTLLDNVVYVDVDNLLYAKATVQEIVDYVNTFDLSSFEREDIGFDFWLDLISSENALDFIFKDGLSLGLVKENDNLSEIVVGFEGMTFDLSVETFEDIVYDTNKNYQDAIDIATFVENVINFIANEDLAFEINAQYGEYVVTGKVQYVEEKVSAYLTTTILEKQIALELDNGVIYLDVDGLKIKCALSDIEDLIAYVTEYLGVNLEENMPSTDINVEEVVSQILLTFVDSNLSVEYDGLKLDINSENMNIDLSYSDISVNLKPCDVFAASVKEDYINLYELKELSRAVYNTLKNLSVSGTIDVTLNLFGEDNELSIDYAIGYIDNKLIGYINTEFKGLQVVVYLDGEDVYIDVVGLKVHVNINQIEEIVSWINNTFDAGINLDIDNKQEISEMLKDFKLDFIKSIVNEDGFTKVDLVNGMSLEVLFDDYVRKVIFTHEGRSASLTCTAFDLINLDNLVRDDYRDYSEFTTIIENAYNLVLSKQYNISANVSQYTGKILNNKISADLVLDVTDRFNAYANLVGIGEQITIGYENKMLYFCYGGDMGLRLCFNEGSLQEILGIVCSAMGIDTSSIPFLNDFLTKENLDTDNLEELLPKVDMGNPLAYLEYIKSIDITDEYFELVVRGEKLGDNFNDVAFKIYYANGTITKLVANDFYTNVENDEYMDIEITLNEFESVPSIKNDGKYIDLSDSSDLIRAFVNTSTLDDYHINGKIQLNIDVGLDFDLTTVGVDVRIKKDVETYTVFDEQLGEFVEVEKTKIFGAIELTNYPLFAGINDVNTNSSLSVGRKRTISIYFKDGYVYISTVDAKTAIRDEYHRATKITPDYLFENISYYIQYLLGFTNLLQPTIEEAIQKSQNYTGPMNYGKIVNSYSHSGNKHIIDVNLGEIAHNDQLGSLVVTLTTKNDASTLNKYFLYRLDVDMNILGGKISLTTKPDDKEVGLFLVDIGEPVVMNKANTFFTNYDEIYGLGLDGEYEKEGSGNWKQANTGASEVRFYDNGSHITTMTGNIASPITFPTMNNIIEDDGNVRQEYVFDGWYLDPEFTQKFTSTVFPRFNTNLYAKWKALAPKVYVQVDFVTNQDGVNVNSVYGFAGEAFELPTCNNIEIVKDEFTSILKTFNGWYTESGEKFTSTILPNEKVTTLYGQWTEKETQTYSITIYYNGGNSVYTDKVAANEEYVLPSTTYFNATTKYYTTSNFAKGSEVTNFVITDHTTWYARNQFTVTIASAYTTANGSAANSKTTMYEGSTVTLPSYAFFSKDMGTYTAEYTFLGYKANGGELITAGTAVTPNGDVQYIAEWQVKEYCVVTFSRQWKNPSEWIMSKWIEEKVAPSIVTNTNGTNTIRVERRSIIYFSDYVTECRYAYSALHTVKYDFKSVAWADSAQNVNVGDYKGEDNRTIVENCTLYPVWKCV